MNTLLEIGSRLRDIYIEIYLILVEIKKSKDRSRSYSSFLKKADI